MLILIIAGGPDKGRIYELTGTAPIVLGREGDQVKLNDRKVSREHARLWCEGGQWYLEDLGSRHGTYRNHAQLETGQRAKLKDGDYLQIGSSVMVLGRMPAEHAEKLALLAEKTEAGQTSKRKPLVITGAAAIVTLLGLGVYIAIEMHTLRGQTVPRDEFARLQQQLLDAQRESTDQITGSIDRQATLDRQLLNQQQQLTAALDQTHRVIDRHGNAVADAADAFEGVADPILARLDDANTIASRQQLAIERLGEMLAHQQASDNGQRLLAAVDEIKTLIADQPTGEAVVARLQEAIEVNAEATGEAVRVALAEYGRTPAGTADSGGTGVLLAQLLEKLDAVPTRAQVAEEVRLAVAESSAMNEQFMRLVLTELRRTGDQITTDIASAMNDDAGQAQTLMRSVIAELDKRPTGEKLAADLRTAIDEAVSSRSTNSEDLPELMKQVLAELEQRPTSDQLAAELRRSIGTDAQRTESLIARVLEELQQRPTAEQIALQLRSVDEQTAEQTAVILDTILAKVGDQQRLSDQIDALHQQIESMPGRDDEAVREVLTRLEAQAQNSTALLAAIAELKSAVADNLPEQLNAVLSQLDEQVRAGQLTDTIERAIQRVAIAQNEQTQAALAAFSDRLAALPTAEELEAIADSQDALAALLDTSDARAAVTQLSAALESLAGRLPDGPDEQLTRVLAMLEQRAEADLLLAELHDAVAAQSDDAEALKAELLAAIQASSQSDGAALLSDLLKEVETRLATEDSVRQAIRDELQGAILPNQMAFTDARDVTTSIDTPNTNSSDPSTQTRSRLTRLERAYKESFESGQPVRVGAGVVDPTTGRVSEGRLIDPAVAKALGFETWRDWYLTDRHAEQMRLQQQALRQRNAIDAREDGTIQLPPVERSDADAGPEQD